MTPKRPFNLLNPEKQWEFGSRGNIGAKIVANISTIVIFIVIIITIIIIITITIVIYYLLLFCPSYSYRRICSQSPILVITAPPPTLGSKLIKLQVSESTSSP